MACGCSERRKKKNIYVFNEKDNPLEGVKEENCNNGPEEDVPSIIKEYKFHRMIGHGAYGTVWYVN